MSEESFLLLNLNQGKEVASALQNETAKKILEYLTDKKKVTESEISKALGIPMSTTHYNLQQLRKAKLVKANEYHYSKKGKEVLHYSLAKKFIIIAPGETDSTWLRSLKRILPAFAVTALIGLIYRSMNGFNSLLAAKSSIAQDTSIRSAPMAAEMVQEAAMDTVAASPSTIQAVTVTDPFVFFLMGALALTIIILIQPLFTIAWHKLKKHSG